MIKTTRAIIRLLTFIFTSSGTLLVYFFVSIFKGLDMHRALRYRRRWLHFIVPFLGVKYEIFGKPPEGVGLIVCNHRSYIDPAVILLHPLAMPIGKIEVSKWPLIGKGAKATGAIYVDRDDKGSRRSTRVVALEAIKDGFSVLVFPEGTTSTEPTSLEFRRGMFEECAKAEVPVTLCAIDFKLESDAWVGDDTFLRHFIECFGKRHTHVKLWYGPTIIESDPIKLVDEAKSWIDEHITKLKAKWEEEKVPA